MLARNGQSDAAVDIPGADAERTGNAQNNGGGGAHIEQARCI